MYIDAPYIEHTFLFLSIGCDITSAVDNKVCQLVNDTCVSGLGKLINLTG